MNNLLKRTFSGIAFLAIMVAGIVIYPPLFPIIVLFSIYMMMKEFYTISMGESYLLEQKLLTLSACMLFATFFMHFDYGTDIRWMAAAAVPFFAALIAILFKDNSEQYFKVPFLFAGYCYAGLLTSLIPLVVFHNEGYDGWILLGFFIIIWCSDVGAYCLGTLLGQRPDSWKLAPKISPKKSWWGVAGGVILGIAAACLMSYMNWIDVPMYHAVALGVIISCGGICGDLFESVLKRYFHVKDSGNLIPGHGGLLDRFDSSLFAIPMAMTYLLLFNLI